MNPTIGGDKSPSSVFPARNFMLPQKPLAYSLSGGAALASALGFKLDQKPQSTNPLLTKPQFVNKPTPNTDSSLMKL